MLVLTDASADPEPGVRAAMQELIDTVDRRIYELRLELGADGSASASGDPG